MLEDPGQTEALARLEWDGVKMCLRIARKEGEQARPQQWLIDTYRRSARRHLENWAGYRAIVAARLRREQGRAA